MMGRGGFPIYTPAMGIHIIITFTLCFNLILAVTYVSVLFCPCQGEPDAGTEELIGYSGSGSSFGLYSTSSTVMGAATE